MFDAPFEIFFVLIPLGIFIGRAVLRLRNRRAAPPPPPPRIPVALEDEDDDYEYEFYAGMPDDVVPVRKQVPKPVPKQEASTAIPFRETSLAIDENDNFNKVSKIFSGSGQIQAAKEIVTPATEQNFSFNLGHLSPLKQAVVMAEVLGPPKGMI